VMRIDGAARRCMSSHSGDSLVGVNDPKAAREGASSFTARRSSSLEVTRRYRAACARLTLPTRSGTWLGHRRQAVGETWLAAPRSTPSGYCL
jgi:hypothetical protein